MLYWCLTFTVSCVHLRTQSLPHAVICRAGELCLPHHTMKECAHAKHTSNSTSPVIPLLQLWALHTRCTTEVNALAKRPLGGSLLKGGKAKGRYSSSLHPATFPHTATTLSTLMPGISLLCTAALILETVYFPHYSYKMSTTQMCACRRQTCCTGVTIWSKEFSCAHTLPPHGTQELAPRAGLQGLYLVKQKPDLALAWHWWLALTLEGRRALSLTLLFQAVI